MHVLQSWRGAACTHHLGGVPYPTTNMPFISVKFFPDDPHPRRNALHLFGHVRQDGEAGGHQGVHQVRAHSGGCPPRTAGDPDPHAGQANPPGVSRKLLGNVRRRKPDVVVAPGGFLEPPSEEEGGHVNEVMGCQLPLCAGPTVGCCGAEPKNRRTDTAPLCPKTPEKHAETCFLQAEDSSRASGNSQSKDHSLWRLCGGATWHAGTSTSSSGRVTLRSTSACTSSSSGRRGTPLRGAQEQRQLHAGAAQSSSRWDVLIPATVTSPTSAPPSSRAPIPCAV